MFIGVFVQIKQKSRYNSDFQWDFVLVPRQFILGFKQFHVIISFFIPYSQYIGELECV